MQRRPPAPRSRIDTRFALPAAALRVAPLLAIAALLSACGTTPRRPAAPAETPGNMVGSAPSGTAPRGGGYYLDDGPGDNAPANLDAIPDAVPRNEPLHRGAARPYVVMGRSYTPMTGLAPYKARGVASWYGRRYHGKPTSSGEPYDMYGMTAAHPVLPIPSYVRVTSVRDGRSVILRVNDRGPFLNDRLIDLSYTAAYKLGIVNGGSALVEVETITPDSYASAALPVKPAAPVAVEADPIASLVASVPAFPAETQPVATPRGIFLQLGAFGARDNADSFLSRVQVQADWLADRLQVVSRDGYFRVQAGPYESQAAARAEAERVAQSLGTRPLVVTR